MIACGVEHHGTLLQRDSAQVAEGILHQCLPFYRQGCPAARGVVDPYQFLGRHVLYHLGARQAALPLFLGQLVYLMQLLDDPLLVGRGKAAEVGVVAQHPFLLLDG